MAAEHFDVLIVGAGLSGVGAGCHLRARAPDRSYVILEGRDASGGTWDLFRYPGVRSDSDMHTLGYAFRPWTGTRAIADGASILDYVRQTARDFGIDRHIRYGHRVTDAAWSTDDAVWTVTATRDGATVTFTASFLLLCGGYYSYDGGYVPAFPGLDRFEGVLVHPQAWPEDLDYAGKRVVVIGSGATAVTLVPAMAQTAAHVTMLQRSPTYVVPRAAEDALAHKLRRWLPARLVHGIVRWRNLLIGLYFYHYARAHPAAAKTRLLGWVRQALGPGYDVDTHFTPRYDPWDQRICVAPDGDLFQALKAGSASVVTEVIETFTPTGVRLESGVELPADIVVTATGLILEPMNGLRLLVDGRPIEPGALLGYKGMMYEGVPNLATVFGYTNASWTLRSDLTCEYVCRLLNHLRRTGLRQATPRNRDPQVGREPWLSFSSGYVRRAMRSFPKQGTKPPWRLHQNYLRDLVSLRYARIDDGVLEFSNPPRSEPKA